MGSILGVPIALAVTLFSNKIADVWTWYKWMIAYIYIKILQRQTKPRFDLYDFDAFDDPYKIGVLPPEAEMKLESPHDELDLNEAADEILFYGVNSSSECFVARISRICSDEADVGLYVKLRNGNTYQLENVNCLHQTSKPSNKIFVGGGLKMHYQEPMRKWRIFYKGLLREFSGNDETSSRMVYVKLGLQWRTGTDCFDTLSDINCSDLASALASSKWKGYLPDITKFHNAVNAYYQGGVIRGEIYIDGTDKATELYVFGEKIRYLGNAPTIEGYRFSKLLGHITKNGRLVHITELHIPGIVQNFKFGHIVTPEGKIETATKIDIKRHLSNEASLNVSFYADELDFNLTSSVDKNSSVVDFGNEPHYTLSISDVAIDMSSRSGRGVYIKMYTSKPQKKRIPKCTMQSSILKDTPLTVDFSSDVCQIPDITGGKGSSLGKLTQLSKNSQNFIVPKGIVVTTSSYEKFITEDILKEIKNLEDVLYGNAAGDVKIVCKRVMNAVIQTELPKEVEACIAEHLKREFSADAYNQMMFAIRSSATGEDSEEMSAAGQMETFLGVRNLDQILLSVKKCWASQFSYVSVQYKRQNGQELNTPMAVVIQEMVLCEVAGVLFTCDPLTGNPTVLTITANYGLGESVVSGSEEPDTVILERSPDESLGIKEKVIGAKSHRIIIKDETGPTQEDVPEQQREECALSDKLSLRLGKIALYIEKCYGSERDIEWGYLNDIFYIFQSRPVTSNNEETDYEIDHENDYPIKVENEYFTKCNVGEVMPGATSPLGIDVIIKFFNSTIRRKNLRAWGQFSSKYCLKGLVTMYNHVMLFTIDIFKFMGDGKSAMSQSSMIGLFGRVVEDKELFELVQERFHKKTTLCEMLKNMLPMLFQQIFRSYDMLEKTKKRYDNNGLSWDNCKTSADLSKALVYSCTYPSDALRCHLISTNKSSFANMLLLSLLRKPKGEIDTDVYNDLSEILSCADDVESAEVPAAMQSLAYRIGKDKSPEEFQNMSIEEAENWLLTSTSDSGQMFRDFLKKHGHRCLKEFDMRTPKWGENPKQLIKLLQNLTKSVSKDSVKKTTKSFQELLSKLKTPLSWKAKMLLKYVLLPMSKNGVQGREASKSVLIRAQNEWRKGYKKLANLMVSEGRIPDGDLLFFMSVLEIQELLRSRSPKIIARAVHRRRRHQILDTYIFPEICSGIPKPIQETLKRLETSKTGIRDFDPITILSLIMVNTDDSEIINNDEYFSMKGMPVSQGVAKGFARVALNLDEASFLKPGEILITYSTDIGWSPYFPALGGVVTELGGLISHGAVVSREYGLPCIAGLHGATRQFHTGDYVLIDANKGVLQKLPAPE